MTINLSFLTFSYSNIIGGKIFLTTQKRFLLYNINLQFLQKVKLKLNFSVKITLKLWRNIVYHAQRPCEIKVDIKTLLQRWILWMSYQQVGYSISLGPQGLNSNVTATVRRLYQLWLRTTEKQDSDQKQLPLFPGQAANYT